jgi:hypothetical protein
MTRTKIPNGNPFYRVYGTFTRWKSCSSLQCAFFFVYNPIPICPGFRHNIVDPQTWKGGKDLEKRRRPISRGRVVVAGTKRTVAGMRRKGTLEAVTFCQPRNIRGEREDVQMLDCNSLDTLSTAQTKNA